MVFRGFLIGVSNMLSRINVPFKFVSRARVVAFISRVPVNAVILAPKLCDEETRR